MDRLYVPTPAQVAGMQAEVEKRLTRYDQVWRFVSTFDATALCKDDEGCKCNGAQTVIEEIRAILEDRAEQGTSG
jgi:hypothetical protein